MHTLFILSSNGEIIMEKHWKGTIPRAVGEDFWTSHVMKAPSFREVMPVIATSKHYLVHIQRGSLFFLAVLHGEAPPLMTLELLERISGLFQDYFGGLTEDVLKDNFVTCYQLLEELVDNGFPMTTEPTVLKDLVPPPSLLNKMKSVVNNSRGEKDHSPPVSSLENSPVPWRKMGVKYTNNEIFFDVFEELDVIIDANGQLITSEISGRIEANSRLSGMPDVLLSFFNPKAIEDVAFHPCVRFARYEQDRSLSFVPPDGHFELMKYRSSYGQTAPFYVTPKLSFHHDNGRVNIILGLRAGGRDVPEKGVVDVKVMITLPKNTESVRLESNQGQFHFDTVTKELKWEISRIHSSKSPSLQGSIIAATGTTFPEESCPTVLVDFRLPMKALSGLSIDAVTVSNEKYKPYKGTRSQTKAGQYQIRTA
eukprot:NODE_555_length_1550_cov_140.281146_g417_i0.p1 GENE.NODE_555_length_1550_cov_140.281146_g417_i0~~NODE_555_length_1550_cov_140.281146_g417_i0.p1  ORF type:complete len:424 (-),score=89.83 NODE_555_length_1550_cov_140.281146_g417_i0:118-1389(-)